MANDIIPVKKRGSFHVGGERTVIQGAPVEDLPYFGTFTFHSDPNGTHWTKQMYVQYTELAGPKAPYPLLMWHGGGLTGVTWETTPDGREGWDTLFLRMGFDVYVSDAVERGRASWAKFPDVNPTPPIFHSYESRWLNLKMGAVYPEPYEGQRFPVQYYDQLMMQGVPRWMTSDEWTQAAYDQYLERLQKTLPGVILMAHSQGCTFALNAAMGEAEHVTAVDISASAIEMAKANAERNGLTDRMDFVVADVFDLLPELITKGKAPYDFIILDPPAFTKSRKTVGSAQRGYKEINLRALKLLPRGGYFATASCSHFMPSELFVKMLRSAALDAGVELRQIEARQQSPDHPILWNVPETDYLKFYIFQVV